MSTSKPSTQTPADPTEQSGQVKRSLSLRLKLILAITLTAVLSLAALSYFVFVRARKTQSILGDQLQTTVTKGTEDNLLGQLSIETNEANNSLQKVADTVNLSASYAGQLFNQQDILSSGEYWDADQMLVKLPGGQLDNPNDDHAAVFIAAGIPFTQQLSSELNTVMHLNLLDPAKLLADADMVALYFIDPLGSTVYYPNIDLANLVPPDFDVTDQVFYEIGTPENNPERSNVWTPPYQDPAGTGLIVTNVSPIYDGNGKFHGVMAADMQLAKITEQISEIRIADSGYAFLIDSAGHVIAMPTQGYEDFGLTQEVVPANETPKQSIFDYGSTQLRSTFQQMTQGESGMVRVQIQDKDYYLAFAPLPITGYSLALVVPLAEVNEPVIKANAAITNEMQSTINFGSLLLVVIALGAVLVSTGISRTLASPVEQLTQAAQRISAGNLEQTVEIAGRDEFGLLADAFNSMTRQLRDVFVTLEQRVADRTKALSISSEISRRLSSILDRSQLVTEVVNQIQLSYNYYHVHIYLTDEKNDRLVMAGGTGEAGRNLLERKHYIPRGKGLVGRAAESGEIVLVADTKKDKGWLPNPLLPETKSELSVPIVTGERKVLGVLDVQNNTPESLTEQDAQVIYSIANQMAVALQNIDSYERAEQSIKDLDSQRYALDQHSIVAITDVTGRITYVNDKFVEISKYSREELIGQDHRVLNSGYHSKEFMRNLWVTIANGKVFHAEIKNKAKDGTLYWVDTTIVPFLNTQGKPYQYVAIRTDITQRKRDEAALAKRAIELEAVAQITEKIQSTTTIESALQIAARELGHVFGKQPASVSLDMDALRGNETKTS